MDIHQATTKQSDKAKLSLKERLTTLIDYVKAHWYLKFLVLNLMLILVIGLLTFIFINIMHVHMSKNSGDITQNKPSTQYIFTQKLDDIQGRLSVIEQSLRSDKSQKNMSQLEVKLQGLNQNIQTLSNNNAQAIESSLSSNSDKLQQQISQLSHNIAELKQSMQKTIYLKSSALPFKVISIDSIEAQNVVTVAYDYKNVPLEQHDALAGWALLKADYALQTADFVNSKQQHVFISLSHGG